MLPAISASASSGEAEFGDSVQTALSSAPETLQAIIDAAPPFAVIELADGVYTGPGNRDLVITGKNIMLVSTSSPDRCILDVEGEGRGMTFGAGVDNRTLIRGVTIRNAVASDAVGEGGGVRCEGASPVFESCIIESNRASTGGGGMALIDSQAIIRDCLVGGNKADYNAGGGVLVIGGSPIFERTRIFNNTALKSGHLGGGGVYAVSTEARFVNCMIAANRAERNGGGVNAGPLSFLDLLHCTVVSNRPDGLYLVGEAVVENCVLWGGDDAVRRGMSGWSRPFLYSIVEDESDAAHGVRSVPPLLAPETYTLAAGSPCIDAGSDVRASATDIDHEGRWDHPDVSNGPGVADIGADEYVDTDHDGLTDREERLYGSNPDLVDTDHDGLSDDAEVRQYKTNPAAWDTDTDGYPDHDELALGMNPVRSRDGRARLEASRRLLAIHWNTLYGSYPVFHHASGTREDLEEMDLYLEQLSGAMVRGVGP